jgi:hypothetical protein
MEFSKTNRMMTVTSYDKVMDDGGTTEVVTTIVLPEVVLNEWKTQG